ncbi:hypothetical protein [Paenibacillus kribbensis]|uniref:hypothetical protein n=1 Tax=Paenibacillus kribbensis TaxID=172713 RepID=UPI000838BD8B|nr:hypothetical protein [Paenibacillus kribbensis]
MSNSLEILIEPIIRNRLETLYSHLSKTIPEYNQFSTESNQYFQQIRESVPEHLEHTLFLYEDAQISLQSILENQIYLQGFKDAMQFLDELRNTHTG